MQPLATNPNEKVCGEAIHRYCNVFRKSSVNGHTENGIFQRLPHRGQPPIDVRVDHHFFPHPIFMFFVVHGLHDAGSIGAHHHSVFDVGYFPPGSSHPVDERNCLYLYQSFPADSPGTGTSFISM